MKKADLEFLTEVKQRFADAVAFRQATREKIWLDNEKRYMGAQWPSRGDDFTADQIVVNKTFSTIQTIVPFVTGGSVEFVVEPYSGDADSQSARYTSIWLNRLWRTNKFDGQRRAEVAAWDTVVYGDGYLLPSYEVREVVRRDVNGRPIPTSERTIAEFMIENISPWDVWIERFADGLWDARWYFRRYLVPEDIAKDDPRYFFKDDFTSIASDDIYYQNRFYTTNVAEGETTLYAFIEYYDADRKQLIVFSENSEFPHQWIDGIERNLVHVPNNRIPGLPYHMSEVEQVSELQDELNKTRSQMITARRRGVSKIVGDEKAFTPEARDALQSGVINKFVPFDSNVGTISEVLQIVAPAPIPEDAYNVSQLIANDIDEITGVSDYLRGAQSEIRRTATEASILEGAANTKIRNKLKLVERAIREAGQVILELAGEVIPVTDVEELSLYLTGEEAIAALSASGQNIYSEDGLPLDATLAPMPEIFQGKYEVFVQQGSTELRSPETKAQKLQDMFLTLVNTFPTLASVGVIPNLSRALQLWLESLGITDVNAIINAPQAIAAYEQAQIAAALTGQLPALGGGAAGPPTEEGQPNAAGVAPPSAPITGDNSGMNSPQDAEDMMP